MGFKSTVVTPAPLRIDWTTFPIDKLSDSDKYKLNQLFIQILTNISEMYNCCEHSNDSAGLRACPRPTASPRVDFRVAAGFTPDKDLLHSSPTTLSPSTRHILSPITSSRVKQIYSSTKQRRDLPRKWPRPPTHPWDRAPTPAANSPTDQSTPQTPCPSARPRFRETAA